MTSQITTSSSSPLDGFLLSADIRESSRRTYRQNLAAFASWLRDNKKDLSSLTAADIVTFKNHLMEEGLSALTARAYLNTAKKFISWAAAAAGVRDVSATVKAPRIKKTFRKMHLTGEQARALECAAATKGKRELALVMLMLHTGVRCIEAARANVEDLSERCGRRILRVQGKGRDEKDAFVILSPKCCEALDAYLSERRAKPSEPLFVSVSDRCRGKRLSARMLGLICKELLNKTGMRGHAYSAHSLRHTTAVAILEATGSIETAQNVLRHANAATTQIYVESIREERRLRQAAEYALDDIF